VSRLEIRLFPSLKEPVSTTDTGAGVVPDGAEIFRDRNDSLFRPAVFSLRRWGNNDGKYKFYLESVKLLKKGEPTSLTAIPSTVVPGSFVTDVEASVLLETDGRVIFQRTDCGNIGNPISLDSATAWVEAYAARCADLEFEWAKQSQSVWLPPTRPKPPSALLRVLMALQARDGRATVSDLMADIETAHTTKVRRNNTRREVIWNPTLLKFDDENDQVVYLTEKGETYIQICKAAGVVT
jgi:hypothetical protein